MPMSSDFLNNLRPSPTHALLIKAALLPGDAARVAHQAWRGGVLVDDIDGPSFRLLPLLAANLVRLGVADPDLPRYRGIRRQQLYRNRTMLHALKPSMEQLASEGIPVMYLKGVAICASVRRDWSLRHMSDIDVLVPAVRAQAAWRVFERSGWSVTESCGSGGCAERIQYLPNVSFRHPTGHSVDLHWRSLWQREHSDQEAAFWARSVEMDCEGVVARVPALGHQLLLVLAHAALSFSPSNYDWIADAYAILDVANGKVDWDEFVEFAARRRLSRVMGAQLEWLRKELGSPVPEEVLRRLSAARPRLLEFVIRGQRLGSFCSLWLAAEVWSDRSCRSFSGRAKAVARALSWYYEVPFSRIPWLVGRKALARSGEILRRRPACQPGV